MQRPYEESAAFLGGPSKVGNLDDGGDGGGGCMRSSCCRCCCVLSGLVGVVLVAVGLVAILMGPGLLEDKILESMALTPGGDRTESWLHPPVQPHLTGYAFHVVNPDAILRGEKPIVEERGPYVYSSTSIKDSDNNMVWHEEDGTLEYRPRKIYKYVPELSGPGLDPYTDVMTVPNIPLWTGLNGLKGQSQFAKDVGRSLIVENGLGLPFINVTFDGLLWGYEDDLPCLRLDRPKGCAGSEDDDDPFSEDGWGDDDEWKKRRKREAPQADETSAEVAFDESKSEYAGLAKPKAEFVNCSCEWGLFRDRNVTMRKPLRFYTGQVDLSLKGIVTEYDGSTELGWWEKGSQCDAVGGQDSSTLPPSITKNMTLDIFISLMCRSIPITFEKVSLVSTVLLIPA